MYILFDIGGTKMRLAYCQDGKTFGTPEIISTPKSFQKGIESFVKLAKKLSKGGDIKAAAGGVAGPIDQKKGCLLNAPNLPDWIDRPLHSSLAAALGAPVFIENDAAIVGLGEAVYGAGKGYDIVGYITVSTGVGGARIVEKRIDARAVSFEPGHQIIDPTGGPCPGCKVEGHLEGYVSGRAIERRFGKKPYEIKNRKIWDEYARLLAYGLNNTIVHWSPNVLVLGGSMVVKEIGIPINRIKYHLDKILTIFPSPPIKKAILGDVGGLYGALVYLEQQMGKYEAVV